MFRPGGLEGWDRDLASRSEIGLQRCPPPLEVVFVTMNQMPAYERLNFALNSMPTYMGWHDDIPFQYGFYYGLPKDRTAFAAALGTCILDIGSGKEMFAAAMSDISAELGIEAHVINLNPQLARESYRERIAQSIELNNPLYASRRTALGGLVQQLPFKDETFSAVVSMAAFPLLFEEKAEIVPVEEYSAGFQEIYRVLQPGGRAYLAPVREIAAHVGTLNSLHIPAEYRPTLGRLGCIVIQKAN